MSQPRKLTISEINDILSLLPPPPGMLIKQREFALNNIKKIVNSQLREIMITDEGIEELTNEILLNYNSAMIKPGISVGAWCAETMGKAIQQTTLNLFHTTDRSSGNGDTGLADLKKIILLTKNFNPSMDIHFKEPQTYTSILNMKKNIIKISLKTIILETEIEYYNTIFDNGDVPWWYHIHSLMNDIPLPNKKDNDRMLRLKFDIRKMVEYNVTLNDIIIILEEQGLKLFLIYVSPIEYGIIDIWPIKEYVIGTMKKITDLSTEMAVYAFINNIFIPKMDSYIIKGIVKITDIFPAEHNMWFSMYQSEELIDENKKIVRIHSTLRYKIMGPSWENTLKMIEQFKIKIISHEEYKFIDIIMPEKTTNISEYVRGEIKKYNDKEKEDINNNSYVDNLCFFKYFYAISAGSDLRAVINLPFVNERVTSSNGIMETFYVYGRDAAHSIILKELFRNLKFKDSTPFNVRHVLLITDNMMYKGKPLPNNHIGIAAQGKNVTAVASSEKQMTTYVDSAAMGSKVSAEDISAMITYGAAPIIGEHAYDEKKLVNGITEEHIRKQLDMIAESSVSEDEITRAINNLMNKQFINDPSRKLLMGYQEDDEDEEEFDFAELVEDPLEEINKREIQLFEDENNQYNSEFPDINISPVLRNVIEEISGVEKEELQEQNEFVGEEYHEDEDEDEDEYN